MSYREDSCTTSGDRRKYFDHGSSGSQATHPVCSIRTKQVLLDCLRVYCKPPHYYIGLEGQEKKSSKRKDYNDEKNWKAKIILSEVIIAKVNLDLLSWVKRRETCSKLFSVHPGEVKMDLPL